MSRFLSRFFGLFRQQRGVAAVEAAIVLPVFLILLIGIIDLGDALHTYSQVIGASREGARLGARGETLFTDAEIRQIIQTSEPKLNLADEDIVITRADWDGSTSTVVISSQDPGSRFDPVAHPGALQSLFDSAFSQVDGGLQASADSFVVVEIFYDHNLLVAAPIIGAAIPQPLPMYNYTLMKIVGL